MNRFEESTVAISFYVPSEFFLFHLYVLVKLQFNTYFANFSPPHHK